jgi:uncharacterized membrane protein (UPF0127 family)
MWTSDRSGGGAPAVRLPWLLLLVALATCAAAAGGAGSAAPGGASPGASAAADASTSPAPAAVAHPAAPPARLDHVPIAVRDLDAAVRTYRDALGFSIKPGRPHANSILNAHLKFRDGTALELITAVEPRDALAERYLRLLAEHEGGGALALDGGPVEPLARTLAELSHPFRTAAGSYYESLSFPDASPLEYLFFIVVHRRPPDLPEHLTHANGARRLHAVWISRATWSPEEELFGLLGAEALPSGLVLPGAAAVREMELGSGRLYLLETPGAVAGRPVVGATVEVARLERARASLAPAAREAATTGTDARGRFIRIPPEAAHGMWIEFLEPGARAATDEDVARIEAASGTHRVRVEIADTPERIATGLMEREALAVDAGMFFLFGELQSRRRGFWMYRTRIPLDIAFLDGEGRIVAIREMEPCSSAVAFLCRSYAPGEPYMAALEVNRGYFAARGIGVGARVVLERADDASPGAGGER